MSIEAMKATPHKQLIDELMDSRIPKTEREHAAAREIEALRQAIAAAEEQEPVAYQATQEKCRIETVPAQGGLLPIMQEGKDFTITHPQPKREWVGLTDEEIADVANGCRWSDTYHADFAQAIEAKLREKNGC